MYRVQSIRVSDLYKSELSEEISSVNPNPKTSTIVRMYGGISSLIYSLG